MRLSFINGLRGYAILAVIYHHFFKRMTPTDVGRFEIGDLSFSLLSPLFNGWLGVNLFFVLSGFVLALPYFDGRRSFEEPGHVRWFYTQRARRLLPLYYLSVMVCMIFLRRITMVEEPFRDLFLMATATFNFHPDTYAPAYNWVLWSLGLEVWFSIVFPLIMLAISRFGMLRVGIFIAVVAMATRLEGHDYRWPAIGAPNLHLNPIKDSFVGRLDDFFTGILVCHLCLRGKPLFGRISGGLPLLLLGFAILVPTLFAWDNVVLRRLPSSLTPWLHITVNASIFCIIYALYGMRGAFRRIVFENYPIQLAGVMCYSLYVWHGVTRSSLNAAHPGQTFGYTPQNLLLIVVCVSVMAALSYRYIEFGHVKDWRSLFLLGARADSEPTGQGRSGP